MRLTPTHNSCKSHSVLSIDLNVILTAFYSVISRIEGISSLFIANKPVTSHFLSVFTDNSHAKALVAMNIFLWHRINSTLSQQKLWHVISMMRYPFCKFKDLMIAACLQCYVYKSTCWPVIFSALSLLSCSFVMLKFSKPN